MRFGDDFGEQSMGPTPKTTGENDRRRSFLEAANAAFESLRADSVAWREEVEEREAWEALLSDDVE